MLLGRGKTGTKSWREHLDTLLAIQYCVVFLLYFTEVSHLKGLGEKGKKKQTKKLVFNTCHLRNPGLDLTVFSSAYIEKPRDFTVKKQKHDQLL